jgi:integrase
MTYGINLEKRKFGVYYFRQTLQVGEKQIVKRVSLHTKDTKVAKFLAIQLKARIDMVDLSKIKKFEVVYDANHQIQSVKVNGDADAGHLLEYMKLVEIQKAEEHKREMEALRFKKELEDQEKSKFTQSPLGQELTSLYETLSNNLKPKVEQGSGLERLKNDYLKNLKVSVGTKYKYTSVLTHLIEYGASVQVSTIEGITRKFVYGYLLHLRNTDKKSDKTIKNEFNALSSFYNQMLRIGETKEANPFVSHHLDYEEEARESFTSEELEKIFSDPAVKANKTLFYVLLLLATTGARPNEICQLWTDDIVIESKVGAFHTIRFVDNAERGQKLKNKTSRRTIYLNDLLVKFGFISYLSRRKFGMIFDLKKPALKNYSTFISEDFTKVLRRLGIQKKTMYCFRHTVISRMGHAQVTDKVNRDMAGHEGQGTNEQVYQEPHTPAFLKSATEEILSYKDVKALKPDLLNS